MAPAGSGAAAGPVRRSFPRRLLGALRLDAAVFEELEHDPAALAQAAGVVVLGGLARGVAAFGVEGAVGLVGSVLGALVAWFASTAVVTAVGVRLFHGTSSFEELLRTLGFAAAPLLWLVLAALPLGSATWIVLLGAHAMALAAFVVAARQALDVDTTRALAVCACALGAGAALAVLVGLALAVLAGG